MLGVQLRWQLQINHIIRGPRQTQGGARQGIRQANLAAPGAAAVAVAVAAASPALALRAAAAANSQLAALKRFETMNPLTPADGKGERVREERLWTTRNTTTGLGKLSKGAKAEQRQWQ